MVSLAHGTELGSAHGTDTITVDIIGPQATMIYVCYIQLGMPQLSNDTT